MTDKSTSSVEFTKDRNEDSPTNDSDTRTSSMDISEGENSRNSPYTPTQTIESIIITEEESSSSSPYNLMPTVKGPVNTEQENSRSSPYTPTQNIESIVISEEENSANSPHTSTQPFERMMTSDEGNSTNSPQPSTQQIESIMTPEGENSANSPQTSTQQIKGIMTPEGENSANSPQTSTQQIEGIMTPEAENSANSPRTSTRQIERIMATEEENSVYSPDTSAQPMESIMNTDEENARSPTEPVDTTVHDEVENPINNPSQSAMDIEEGINPNGLNNPNQTVVLPDNCPRPRKRRKRNPRKCSNNKPKWTQEEAKQAWNVEKEYDLVSSRRRLMVTLPDFEVQPQFMRNVVPEIQNVFFRQPHPWKARSFFVVLKEDADPDRVIEEINNAKFGEGYLRAEFKKDIEGQYRKDVGPEGIDPLSLYVGNLSLYIRKKEVTEMFPNHKRIDIGYSKKMKQTRYAFVSFKNVKDSIEAFKRMYGKTRHSRNLIIRFLRLRNLINIPVQSTDTSDDNQGSKPDNNQGDNRENGVNDSHHDRDNKQSDHEHLEIDPNIVKTEPVDVTPFLPERDPNESLANLAKRRKENPKIPFVEPKEEPTDNEPANRLPLGNGIKKEENSEELHTKPNEEALLDNDDFVMREDPRQKN